MSEVKLPELPPPALRFEVGLTKTGERLDYTADQMRAYATAAVLAERDRIARECDSMGYFSCAAAIRRGE